MPASQNSFPAHARWAYLLAGAVIAFHLYVAAGATVVVPLVDGWAVWNRIMKLQFGEVSWLQYLFEPHGAHPHSIVFLLAWVDAQWGGAQQHLMAYISYAAIAGCALFAVARVLAWGGALQWGAGTTLLAAVAAAALMTSLADTETMLQPFQVVMSVSRLTYLLLLWYLIKYLSPEAAWWRYVTVAVLAAIAATFHGSGYIFAAVFLVVHLVRARHWATGLGAVMPAMALAAAHAWFAVPGGEVSRLGALLSADAVWTLFKAFCAYFATPLAHLLPTVGGQALWLAGAVVMLACAALTAFCAARTVKDRFLPQAQAGLGAAHRNEWIFAWCVGLFVLLSGAAAAAFWVVRTTDMPADPREAYELVLVQPRYAANAVLAYVLVLCALLALQRNRPAAARFSPALPAALLAAATYPAVALAPAYTLDDRLNIATAGLAVGLSPVSPEAHIVWPTAIDDWYWAQALPKTVAYLRGEQKGPWRTLPELYATVDRRAARIAVEEFRISPLDSDSDGQRCRVSGAVSAWPEPLPAKSVVTPLVNGAHQVFGYAVLTRQSAGPGRRALEGFVLCAAAGGSDPAVGIVTERAEWKAPRQAEVIGAAPYDLTDETWLNGVARAWPGYFMEDTPTNRGIFVRGRIVRFANGHVRTIVRQEVANGFLNVFVDGPILDGDSVGHPRLVRPLN